jgi:hypothetical protein
MSRKRKTSVTRRVGLVVALTFIVLMLLLAVEYGIKPVRFVDPLLVAGMNLLFRFGISIAVALITLRAYARNNSIGLLLLGTGMVAFGVSGVIGTQIGQLTQNLNFRLSVNNLGALMAGGLHGVGASLALLSTGKPKPGKRSSGVVAYLAVVIIVVSVALLTWWGVMPPLNGPSGATPLDTSVLLFTFVLFSYSSVATLGTFTWSQSEFLYWYSLALALIAASQLLFMISRDPNDLVAWCGRTLTAAGSLYILAAAIKGGSEIRLSRDTS